MGGPTLSRFYGTTLRLVRDLGPISRTELMSEMELSSPSVTKIVGALLAQGLLQEGSSRTEGAFGRPRQDLVLARNDWRVICASMVPGELSVGLAGADGELVASRHLPLHAGPASAVPQLADAISGLLAEQKVDPARVAGMCLTMPGHVDRTGRHVLAISRAGWREGGLIEAIEARLPWPIQIENRVNAMAFAEAIHNGRNAQQSMVYVYLAQGLGAAYLREGPGAPFSNRDALELGHVVVQTPGLPCECGLHGCFETVLTADLVRQADDGLSDRRWAIAAQGFANLFNLLNPEIVVLAGALTELRSDQSAILTSAIRDRLMPHLRDRIAFQNSELGPQAPLLGAAAVALDRFYFSGDSV